MGKCRACSSRLREDIAVVFDRDPAARTRWEVLTCYPGLHALVWHRAVSHRLWRWGLRWLARWLAHWGRWLTGIEIHPGRHDRAPGLHRPRHGHRHRRDRRDRRRLHALPRRHAGRHVLEQGQAPPDAGQGRRDRRGRQDPRADFSGRWRQDRLKCRRRARRSGRSDRGGHPGADRGRATKRSGAKTRRRRWASRPTRSPPT